MSQEIVEKEFCDAATGFFREIKNHPRIGPSHISLYLSILQSAKEQDFKEPISVFSRNLMKSSKISGSATYSKCIQDLQELGFIKYNPSYNPLLGSLIYLSAKEIKNQK